MGDGRGGIAPPHRVFPSPDPRSWRFSFFLSSFTPSSSSLNHHPPPFLRLFRRVARRLLEEENVCKNREEFSAAVGVKSHGYMYCKLLVWLSAGHTKLRNGSPTKQLVLISCEFEVRRNRKDEFCAEYLFSTAVELNELDLIVIEGDSHLLLRDGKHPITVVV
ncbi:hypothetical protein RHMOL_Rhmol06G0107700 [Rhododendron molle]|uniref:Uncharacterized protein n=1 Tax=Rhododendron molle TaxID=49168 RepID=A0ACC0NCB9_RHOML|nr:hypothetical protein RHMOL_Rhmol06G0107700 [Rhododendron molle]